jgi:adenosylcobinamide-phosphate synthase
MIIILALLLDFIFGDPPNRFHPTAWMGNLISWLLRYRPYKKPKLELLYGLGIILAGTGLFGITGYMLAIFFRSIPLPFGWLGSALALKSAISLRGLYCAAGEVQTALEVENLPEARRLLSWHLVSRDTSQLDESRVIAAAIESVAENISDGIIAPLFFYVVGGLPGALAYRFINTADSMLGYRDPAREWLGKIPAKLDDLLNLIPARLTGLFIVLSAALCGRNAAHAWRIMWRDASQTASPNAGVPMSAMAGALNVELEKIDHYRLGAGLRKAALADLVRARVILFVSVLLSAFLFSLSSFLP